MILLSSFHLNDKISLYSSAVTNSGLEVKTFIYKRPFLVLHLFLCKIL